VTPELAAAYSECRAIAKREAKNFYYGFMALPPQKRDAMCAVYAFMRRADDISDDESKSLEERRREMKTWLGAWHSYQGFSKEPGTLALLAPSRDSPVFLAVRDVQQRYGVSDELLDKLVQGTTMDLDPATPEGVRRVEVGGRIVDQYETMAALERYCYLVASVVGLTTIRIFGFTHPDADVYAEQLGLAFQLTNILRDVNEDAERGRVYLPEDLMGEHMVDTAGVLATKSEPSEPMRDLLSEIAIRAESLYGAADRLIPLLDADSRAAMRVLVDIYHLLLKRIVAERFDVFRQRVSVSTPRKLSVLAKGLMLGAMSRGGPNG
jgi:phytoene synthase